MVDCFNLQEYDPITEEEDEESEDCLESNIGILSLSLLILIYYYLLVEI